MAVKLSSIYQRILSALAEMIEQDVLEMLRLLNDDSEERSIVRIEKSFSVEERRDKITVMEHLLEEN